MAVTVVGLRDIQYERDDNGTRTYSVVVRVQTDTVTDGPLNIVTGASIPGPGASYDMTTFVAGEVDAWAFRTPGIKVRKAISQKEEITDQWDLTLKYTTLTPGTEQRCQDVSIESPLDEPQKISGSFDNYKREITKNRFGNDIRNSAYERMRGAELEFDHGDPTVIVEQNVLNLELPLLSQMYQKVNDSGMWGVGARCVKLSNVSWERKLYGVCTFYYTRKLEFSIKYNTFDRDIIDEGTKALSGHWENGVWVLDEIGGGPPDPTNPNHFIQYVDLKGNPTTVILNGAGIPASLPYITGSSAENPGSIHIEYYDEVNMFLLGIPSTL